MTREQLFNNIKAKQSFLCIGLDTDITKIPEHLKTAEHPMFEFNKQIIDATHKTCVAYKLNTAFYEANGLQGWISLEKTIDYLNTKHPELFTIADAKRGDIGNTSAMYAQAFLEKLNFDSITVAPYMGSDSVKPFLGIENKWVILLALTSNPGADDFQKLNVGSNSLYTKVLETSKRWATEENMMYVVGATKADALSDIRKIIPNHFMLVPGVGAQGGSLTDVAKYGMNNQCGLLVNSSRGIIYASTGKDFAEKAFAEANTLQSEMASLLDTYMK